MIVIQNILFSFVFVNLHYQESLDLFQEGDFCFICMQISCFHLNRYRLIQLQSWICHVFQISNVYIVFWIRNKSFSDLHQFLIRGDIILKIKVWCSLNSCFLYVGHYCTAFCPMFPVLLKPLHEDRQGEMAQDGANITDTLMRRLHRL